MFLNTSKIFLKKYIFLWFLLIFVGICHDFGWFICYLDPDPFDESDPEGQNDTDPIGYETLHCTTGLNHATTLDQTIYGPWKFSSHAL